MSNTINAIAQRVEMRFFDRDYEKGYLNYLTVFKKAKGLAETTDPNKTHSHFMKGMFMSRLFYFGVVVFLAMSIGHAQDINGKWKGEMQSPNGPMELTFNFKVSGDTLNGTVASPMGELPISNGKINGKTFSFDVNANEFTINHQCIVMSDSISMKVPGMPGGEDMAIILKRVPELNKESK
jgi:hypothetical protein